MKLILDLDQRPDGRLAGSVELPGDPARRSFWGVLELVACVEELRETAARTNDRRGTVSQPFFTDQAFEFETRALLGNVHYGCGDVGEVLATVAAITDGDDSSWVAQWRSLAARVEAIATDSQTRGHQVSARNAYLRAAAYYATALSAIDGAEDGEALLGPVFIAHRRCFHAHVSLFDPPAEPVAIPYEGGTLSGYLFVPAADGQARPTLILNNGSDGPVTAVWPGLGAPALARGYNALVFDGPGQQSMLFERHVPFRPDWEHVITPVVDFLEKRPEVDAGRLALYGISQAGYWVPRALAFEHRIAAAVADPGVDDVAASWRVHLPSEMLTLLDAGDQEKFDAFMAIGMQSASPRERQVMQWRAKPYGTSDSAYALFKAVEQYRLGDLTQRIRTPIMITDPEGEQFWPGQSRRLYDALPGPKVLVPFTQAEGADMHCEPMARSLLEQRMFDWLDETLSARSARLPGGVVMEAATRNSRARVVLWSMTLANAMILVDQTAVPLALPNIMQDFHVGSQQVQWVMNASLLPLAGLLVLGGRLGDMFGRRRVFIMGACVFTGASAAGGLAPAFAVLLACRVLQGAGGALMLPNTVAIVSAAFPDRERGRALGLMGGAAAIAGALGPTIGGALTAALSWRAVLLVNCPLAVLAVAGTLRAVPPDKAAEQRPRMDLAGTVLLTIAVIGLVFGLSQSQAWGWASPGVLVPLIVSAGAAAAFLLTERAVASPLMNLNLLRRHPNYLGSTISQFIAGMAEMGLALLFPLLLILNLQMSPALAGLALIPTTLPMVFIAPLAGRWYDRAGGRPPLVAGFAVLLASGLLLAWGVHAHAYLPVLPGLLLYGTGLALILTVNDPVSIDTVPARDHGQASGVSATAEQFGGAVGIAVLYLIFHATYLNQLRAKIAASPLPAMTRQQGQQFKDAMAAAESTGLQPKSFNSSLAPYLLPARAASAYGYSAAFVAVSVLCLVALVLMILLIRKPSGPPEPATTTPAQTTPAESRVGATFHASPSGPPGWPHQQETDDD